jgi:hypothetical protein
MSDIENASQKLEADLRSLFYEAIDQKENAYKERDICVALIARMAIALGLKAGLGRHDENDQTWDKEWKNIIFVDLPSGQVSWHIHESELSFFDFLGDYQGNWDGHTTAVKYNRVLNPDL